MGGAPCRPGARVGGGSGQRGRAARGRGGRAYVRSGGRSPATHPEGPPHRHRRCASGCTGPGGDAQHRRACGERVVHGGGAHDHAVRQRPVVVLDAHRRVARQAWRHQQQLHGARLRHLARLPHPRGTGAPRTGHLRRAGLAAAGGAPRRRPRPPGYHQRARGAQRLRPRLGCGRRRGHRARRAPPWPGRPRRDVRLPRQSRRDQPPARLDRQPSTGMRSRSPIRTSAC